MGNKYKIGNLIFTLDGSDPVLNYLKNELSPISILNNAESHIDFYFNYNTPNKIIDGIYVPPIICSDREIIVEWGGLHYYLTKVEDKLFISIRSKLISDKNSLYNQYLRFKNWNFLAPGEILAKNFMYDIFDFITQIKNVEINQSYIHASVVNKKDKAVAFIAWGGIGKTTALLKLILEHGWKYLSDDLCIINKDGVVFRSPKKMQIYAYNIKGQDKLKNILLKNRTIIDKINWYYKKFRRGEKGVRRRVSAEELFVPEAISANAKLTDAFLMERAEIDSFQENYLSPKELAKKAAIIVINEINPFFHLSNAVYSVQDESIIPRCEELKKNTERILLQAFSSVNLKLIKIPVNANPDELTEYLKQKI